jgi:xanthine dehydrogenase molybdenum-binding subunit
MLSSSSGGLYHGGTFSYDNIPNFIPPEPFGAIALWEEPNKATLWVSNQSLSMDKIIFTHVMARKVDVRIFGGPCGGSYGSKMMSWQVSFAVLLSRQQAGR